jgi:ABC-type sugar transport system ATPase subunit
VSPALKIYEGTTIQLVERFYDPLAGHITVDGQDIADFNVQSYRKNIALVSQEPTLYAGTVKFNILLGCSKPEDEVTQDELETACKNAKCVLFSCVPPVKPLAELRCQYPRLHPFPTGRLRDTSGGQGHVAEWYARDFL